MAETLKIYTEEEERQLKEFLESDAFKRSPFNMGMGVPLMDAVGKQGNVLQDMLNTLQRIEAILLELQSR